MFDNTQKLKGDAQQMLIAGVAGILGKYSGCLSWKAVNGR
jgi:hypothetical protein